MNRPLTRFTSKAAFMPETNIDTDIIFPARYLLRTERAGLGECAFRDRRLTAAGDENPDFAFHRPHARGAKILIAGPGFGCGSSREHAVWALVDYGVQTVIAPSFGDIFAGNAAKNGLLLLSLPDAQISALGEKAASGADFLVDMYEQTLQSEGQEVCRFGLSEEVQQAFLQGWDETDVILNRDLEDIKRFEAQHKAGHPWIFATA